MEQNIQIINADKYLTQVYSENQLIENQNQTYYITAGMDEIKDLYNNIQNMLTRMKDNINKINSKIEHLEEHDQPLRYFEMIVERYSRYNPSMKIEDILKHPRVIENKPTRDKYKEQIRELQISLKNAKDDYNNIIEEKTIECEKLRDKFALYSAVLGKNETLEQFH